MQPFACGCVARCICGTGAFGPLLSCGCRGVCRCRTVTTQIVVPTAVQSVTGVPGFGWPGVVGGAYSALTAPVYPQVISRPVYGGCPGGLCY
jgi:hypothetical protein